MLPHLLHAGHRIPLHIVISMTVTKFSSIMNVLVLLQLETFTFVNRKILILILTKLNFNHWFVNLSNFKLRFKYNNCNISSSCHMISYLNHLPSGDL